MDKNLTLLTGEPRVGKSTVIARFISMINRNYFCGFYTEEIKESEERTGFRINTLCGKQGVLASIYSDSKVRIGRYGVNIEILEDLCLSSISEGILCGKPIIIDEIGPIQVCSEKYKNILTHLSEANHPVIGTIFYKSHPWIDEFKSGTNIKLIEVTKENRNLMPEELYKLLVLKGTD